MLKQCLRCLLPSTCLYSSQQAQIPPGFHLGTITTVQDNQVGISISDFGYETFDLRIEEIRVGDPVYWLRQELGDILTVPAHIDFGETTCKVGEVRAGCIVMSGKDGKLLVLPGNLEKAGNCQMQFS